MPRITNQELLERQLEHERKDEGEFKLIKKEIKQMKNELVPKVNDMHDYIIGQRAIEGSKNKGTWITPDIIKIILFALLVAALALGGKDLLKGIL